MPTLRQWQQMAGEALSAALSDLEAGYVFPVLDWDAAKPAGTTPFGVIRSGADGIWYDPTEAAPIRSGCLATGYLTIYLMAGDPGSEDAVVHLADKVELLIGDRLRSLKTHELNTSRYVPPLGVLSQPGPIEMGSAVFWGTTMPLEFPIHPQARS